MAKLKGRKALAVRRVNDEFCPFWVGNRPSLTRRLASFDSNGRYMWVTSAVSD